MLLAGRPGPPSGASRFLSQSQTEFREETKHNLRERALLHPKEQCGLPKKETGPQDFKAWRVIPKSRWGWVGLAQNRVYSIFCPHMGFLNELGHRMHDGSEANDMQTLFV
jgi:hypothetical protein